MPKIAIIGAAIQKLLGAVAAIHLPSSSDSAIVAAARFQNRLFYGYVGVLFVTIVLTIFLFRSGNNVQNAIKADADARIKGADERINQVKTAADERIKQVESAANLRIKQIEADSAKAKRDSDEKIAALEVEASNARLATQELRRNNIESAEKLEAEKRERLALEEYLSPRNIGEQLSFAHEIEKIMGIEVRIDALPDLECRRLQGLLQLSLELAKWTSRTHTLPLEANAEDGVRVFYARPRPRIIDGKIASIDWNEHTRQAAATLAGVLNDRKVDTLAESYPGDDLGPNAIRVVIGMKPSRGTSEWLRDSWRRSKETRERVEKLLEERHGPITLPPPPLKKEK